VAALWSARDLAAQMQVSEYTAVGYLRDGLVPGFQVSPGGPWRVDPDAFAAWKAAKSAGNDPHRIAPRSPRSKAAQSRRRTA